MMLETIVVGALETNCYIIADEMTKDAAIIDPGAEGRRIAKRVEAMGLTVRYILVTHGHMDHMKDAPLLSELYGCPIVVHREEMEYIHSPEVKASPYSAQVFQTFETAVHDNGMLVEDEQHLPLGALDLRVMKVPGHSQASVCYFLEREGTVFDGDTLFWRSIGRTDFYHGSPADLVTSIRQKLLELPDEVRVFPGHGPATTIGEERGQNPFLNLSAGMWDF